MQVSMFLGMPYGYNPYDDVEFHQIVNAIQHGERVEVSSKAEAYKFTFALSQIIAETEDFLQLANMLSKLQMQYQSHEFVYGWLHDWILDCYIIAHQYDLFIEKTQLDVSIPYSVRANINIQVYFLAGCEPRAIDLMRLSFSRKSKFIKEHFNHYLNAFNELCKQYANEKGGWKKIMENHGLFKQTYGSYAFAGLSCYPSIILLSPSYCLYTSSELNEILKNLQREAESQAREKLGMKRVGESWVSETLLFHQLKQKFPDTIIIQHGRPTWLKQQHLDIWFPDWAIAVEFHGKQHFQPVEFFGGEEAFQQNKKRDRLKKYRCTRNGVVLLVVQEGYDLD